MRVLTEAEKDVLTTLGCWLYVDPKSMAKILDVDTKFVSGRRWLPGTTQCQWLETYGWEENPICGKDILEYIQKGGLLYDNAECEGEGMIWKI